MKLKIKLLLLVLSFSGLLCYSQLDEKLPMSVYTSSVDENHLNFNKINSNQKVFLVIESYRFPKVDMDDIEDGFFSVSCYNLFTKPTVYVYDSYNKVIFNKVFFKGFDLRKMHWNQSATYKL